MGNIKETFLNPIFKGNPISVLVLGICSSLAVTVQLKGACVMGLSVIIVTGLSSLICSLLRNTIPNRIRIIVQLVVVAMMVILVDQVLKAYAYSVSKTLSVYIGLIITNCIVMGRIEAFALGNKPFASIMDGLGHMHGYQVFAGDWQAAEEEAGLAVRDLFLASTEEIETVWSIPSAFRAYTDIALGSVK